MAWREADIHKFGLSESCAMKKYPELIGCMQKQCDTAGPGGQECGLFGRTGPQILGGPKISTAIQCYAVTH